MNGAKSIQDPLIGIVGPGRFGSALAFSLKAIGRKVTVRSRDQAMSLADWAAPCGVICLAVRDDQIEGLVLELAQLPVQGKTILIHSGVKALATMDPLARAGAVIGKFHPLQAFTEVGERQIPQGSPFAIEGDIAHLTEPWVQAWSGTMHRLEGDQWQVYHLAAVLAANFLPLFIREGADLLKGVGADDQGALDWLAPLVRHSVEGALNTGVKQPFSGPAIRRDVATIQKHLSWLREHRPELVEIYETATNRIMQR